jgi:anti-sigma factor RsiW
MNAADLAYHGQPEESGEDMPKGNDKTADGRALWERARGSTLDALAAQAPSIDESDLAAYLEGDLDAATCARVEAALASRPDSLELLIAAREALAAGPAPAPESLVARARGLAPQPRPTPRDWAGRLFDWLAALPGSSFEPRRGLAFAAVAAGFLMVSVVGFEMGRAEVMYSTQVDNLVSQDVATLIGQDGEDLL